MRLRLKSRSDRQLMSKTLLKRRYRSLDDDDQFIWRKTNDISEEAEGHNDLFSSFWLFQQILSLFHSIVQLLPFFVQFVDAPLEFRGLRMSVFDQWQSGVDHLYHVGLVVVDFISQRPQLLLQHLDAQQRVPVIGRRCLRHFLPDPELLVLDVAQELTHALCRLQLIPSVQQWYEDFGKSKKQIKKTFLNLHQPSNQSFYTHARWLIFLKVIRNWHFRQ